MLMNIVQVSIPKTNYKEGRTKPISIIAMHWIVGTQKSCDATFKNPLRLASSHYSVGPEIHQYVSEDDTAYSTGPVANPISISIEHEGGPTTPLTDQMYANSARLIADIWKRRGILPLVPHNVYKNTQCPGTLDLARIQRDAEAIYKTLNPPAPQAPVKDVVSEVLAGKWGNNPQRKQRLEAAGYNYAQIQAEINRRLGAKSAPQAPARPSNEQIAREVIQGKWGNGPSRRIRLARAGYNYKVIQSIVNRLI